MPLPKLPARLPGDAREHVLDELAEVLLATDVILGLIEDREGESLRWLAPSLLGVRMHIEQLMSRLAH